MYICICKAVSEKRLQRAVDSGEVVTLRDLSRELGVGTCCGKCVPTARTALGAALSARSGGAMTVPAESGVLPNPLPLLACTA